MLITMLLGLSRSGEMMSDPALVCCKCGLRGGLIDEHVGQLVVEQSVGTGLA